MVILIASGGKASMRTIEENQHEGQRRKPMK